MIDLLIKEDEKDLKNMGFIINEKTNTYTANIITVNGILTSSQHQCIGKAAELFGNGIIKLSTSFTIEVRGIPYEKINDFRKYIEKENLETGGIGPRLRPVVSCIGTDCRYGLTDTLSLSDEIHERIYNKYKNVQLPHRFKVAISGCPNDCTKINLCEIGIMSQYIPNFNENKCKGCKKCIISKNCPMNACEVVDKKLKIDEDKCIHCGRCDKKCPFESIKESKHGFKIYIGGTWGKRVSHGVALSKIFTDKEEALNVIEKAILLYKEQGISGERFATTINRIGFEKVEKQLLDNDLLERKEEIINSL